MTPLRYLRAGRPAYAGLCTALLLEVGCYSGDTSSADTTPGAGTGAGTAGVQTEGGSAGPGPGSGTASTQSGGDTGDTGGTDGPEAAADPRGVRRLTVLEYTNTVRDLLGATARSAEVPVEQIVSGHTHIAIKQRVGYEDVDGYYDLGEAIAIAAAPALATDSACKDATCFKTFATSFLDRAFRHPTPATVRDRHLAVFDAPEAGATQAERLLTFLTLVLSSPHFLYRQEIVAGPAADDPGARELDAYEIASRLSYLVWQSMPDDALFAKAKSGELLTAKGRSAALERMIAKGGLSDGLRAFVIEWMGVMSNRLPSKAVSLLATADPGFATSAQAGFDLTVDHVLGSSENPRFIDLLLADTFVVDAAQAEVLGLTAPPAGFEPTPVPATERRGLLTHPLVLGAHTKEIGASPFPIGKFVYENLMCQTIPPPPPGAPTANEIDTSGKTLRQALEAVTAEMPCIGCHSRIGPPGFAFLPYDPIGRFTANDGTGKPYDTSGSLLVPGKTTGVPFADARELSSVLAEEEVTRRCLAKRLFRWTYGRFETDADAAALESLEAAAVSGETAVVELLRHIAASPEFARVRQP